MISKKKKKIVLIFNESETYWARYGEESCPQRTLIIVSISTYMGEELYFHFQPLLNIIYQGFTS